MSGRAAGPGGSLAEPGGRDAAMMRHGCSRDAPMMYRVWRFGRETIQVA